MQIVGVSEPFDPKEHDMLRRETCDFEIVIPKSDPFYVNNSLAFHKAMKECFLFSNKLINYIPPFPFPGNLHAPPR